jgi:hypothetical protein
MNLTCPECQETFKVPPSQARRRWCSWACRTARARYFGKARRLDILCEVCGGQVKRTRGDRKQRFCSLACRDQRAGLDRRRRVVCVCGHCGSSFEKRPSEVDAGRGKFCSRSCAALARPINGKPSQLGNEAIALFRVATGLVGEVEYRLGPWSIDMAFPDERIAIELDGTYWHGLPAMQERDERKDMALALAGWRVIRIPMSTGATPADIAAAMASAVDQKVCA